jgi:hypothetical protein
MLNLNNCNSKTYHDDSLVKKTATFKYIPTGIFVKGEGFNLNRLHVNLFSDSETKIHNQGAIYETR